MKNFLLLTIALLGVVLSSWAQTTREVPGTYATIQAAIDASVAGDVINVAAGTYAENLTLNKSLDIRGPNYGIDPNASPSSRVAEAIIVPSVQDLALTGQIIYLQASNVSINGFTLDGDNTLISGGTALNGADINTSRGVRLDPDFNTMNHFSFDKNIVKNLTQTGVYLNPNTPVPGPIAQSSFNYIRDNLFSNMRFRAIYASNETEVFVDHNTLTNVHTGIVMETYGQAAVSGFTPAVSNNTITLASTGLVRRQMGISINHRYTNAVDFAITDNTISVNATTNTCDAIRITSMTQGAVTTASNNTIIGNANCNTGYFVWNTDSYSNVVIAGGTITGVKDNGILLTDIDPAYNASSYFDGNYVTIDNVSITTETTGTGIKSVWHTTGPGTYTGGPCVMNAQNGTTITGTSAIGAYIDGAKARINFVGSSPVSFNGGLSNYISLVNAAATNPATVIDATAVSFATKTGATATSTENSVIEDKILHKMDNTSLGLVRVKASELFVTTASGTIQRGIELSASGEVVNVAAGTYIEAGQIAIAKNLTIVGADKATTIIKPNQNTTGNYDPSSAFIYVAPSTSLVFKNFTIDCVGKLVNHAVQSRGTLDIEDCIVQNVRYADYFGKGILFLSGTTGNVAKNITLTNIERIGIHVRGSIATPNPIATIDHVTYTGKGSSVPCLDYGVEFGAGGSGTVDYLTVTNCTGVAYDNSGSAGILATTYYGTGTGATITNSHIYNNSVGMAVGYDGADETALIAHDNKIYNNSDMNIQNTGTVGVNASCNWYGSAVVSEIAAKIDGTVTYIPYIVSDGGPCAGGLPVVVTRAGTIISGHATIQAAIDAATSGDVINVYPGNYNETAPNSSFNGSTYQFGLFFSDSKSNITVQGCKADGTPITNTADIAAFITTNATNNFGSAGTFVVGNSITLRGLQFGSNSPIDDKAIEVLGNGFTFDACRITANAPVYLGDYSYNENGTPADFSDDISSIQAYTISNCHFAGITSTGGVYIANGAGWTGSNTASVEGRNITGCTFDGMTTLAFAGLSPGKGWLLYPTGAATVTGNIFTNAANARYIQSWGVIQAQFSYASYFNDNTFPKKAITTTDGNANNVRGYDASSAFPNVKRIGTAIQPRIDYAQVGDVILVGAGTYPESLSIDKSLTILGPNATTSPNGGSRATEAIIQPHNATAITGNAAGITVVCKGLTFDMVDCVIDGNRFMDQIAKANTNWNFEKTIFKNAPGSTSGHWLLTGSSAGLVFSLNDNLFTQNIQSNGISIWIDSPVVVDIQNNVWEDNGYSGLNLNYAQGVISGNTFRETRTIDPINYTNYQSGMLLAYTSSSLLDIKQNTFTNAQYGIILYKSVAGPISISENTFNSTWRQSVRLSGQQAGGTIVNVSVSGNSFLNYAGVDVEIGNARGDNEVLNASCNWYGTVVAAEIAAKIGVNVAYIPYNVSAVGPCEGGLPVVVTHADASTNGFATIQEAINAGTTIAGDVITVAAGTYVEAGQIVINKDLSIVGADKATTIIKTNQATGSGGDAGGWILVNSGKTFSLSNVTLDGTGYNVRQAIRAQGAITVDNCAFQNITYPGYLGWGVVFFSNGTVNNCQFSNIGRIGINSAGSSATTATITNNTYIGKGTGDKLDYAIVVNYGAHATITGNNISNIYGVANDNSTSAAMMISSGFGAGTIATITGNTVSNCSYGITAGGTNYGAVTVTATNNSLTNIDFNAIESYGTTPPQIAGSCNWWGTTDYNVILTKMNGTVDFVPYLVTDDIVSPDCSGGVWPVHNVTQGLYYQTIQSAISAANTSDEIEVAAGTYAENVTVDKRITLDGAGSGTDGTVISVSSGSAITVTGSGSDVSNRLVIKDVRVTGGASSGIYVTNATSSSFLTFDNVYALANTDGISFAGTGTVTDAIISNSFLSNNVNNGLRIASACPSFIGLTVSNCEMNSNGWQAFSYNASGTNNIGTDFNFTNCSFTNNCSSNANSGGLHDLSFFGFKGNATLTNITVVAYHTANGHGVVFTPQPLTAPAGNITINGMTVSGSVPKSGLYFGTYTDLSNVSLNNVDVSSVSSGNRSGWAGTPQFVVESPSSNAFNIGNTTFKTLGVWSASPVNATSATFKHITSGTALTTSLLADCFQIENQVIHKLDNSALGLVSWVADNVYVTTASGSIQRGVDAASSGWTVNVGPGTFNDAFGLDKSIKLYGANYNISPNTGTRQPETILTLNYRVGTTDLVEIKGFEFTNSGGGNTIDQYVSGNVVLEKNYFYQAAGLFFANPANISIIDNLCSFSELGNEGIFISGNYNGASGTYADIHDNVFLNSPNTGFNLSSVNGIIHNNTFNNIDYYGVLVANTCNLDIYQNQFLNIENPNPAGSPTWGAGIRFYEGFASGLTVNIHDNSFSGNYVGISARPAASFTGTNVTIINNSITGSTTYGLNNMGTGTLNAINNYWGTCPSVSGLATYFPYWSTISGTPGSFVFGGSINNINAEATVSTVCAGSSTTIYATGGSDYLWDHDLGLGSSKVVSPGIDPTTYNVTAKDAHGCAGAFDNVIIGVSPAPVVVITGPASIPSATLVTLIASGATTYMWNTGETNDTIKVYPTSATTYSVTGTKTGCSATATHTVTPVTVSAGPNQFICSGNMATLTASVTGATPEFYSWFDGISVIASGAFVNSINVTPGSTKVYTLTVTIGGSTPYTNVTVFVNSKPIANAGPDITIAPSGSGPLVGSASAGTAPYAYSWSGPGSFSAITKTITASVEGTYSLIVSDAFGCVSLPNDAIVTVVSSGYTVSGNVAYAFNLTNNQMHDVTVTLQGSTTMYTTTTAATGTGNYQILGVADGIYTVSLSSSKPWGGVTSADIIAMQNHYKTTGAVLLHGIKRLAGDVVDNGSAASVILNDRTLVNAKRLNPNGVTFATGNWVFTTAENMARTNAAFVYAEYTNSAGTHTGITLTVGGANKTQNFSALCYGDVDASYTGMKEAEATIVDANEGNGMELSNYPNPFNESTTLRYTMPVEGSALIEVYNLTGTHITTIKDADHSEGTHTFEFKAGSLAPGIYIYTVTVKTSDDIIRQTGKMIITR